MTADLTSTSKTLSPAHHANQRPHMAMPVRMCLRRVLLTCEATGRGEGAASERCERPDVRRAAIQRDTAPCVSEHRGQAGTHHTRHYRHGEPGAAPGRGHRTDHPLRAPDKRQAPSHPGTHTHTFHNLTETRNIRVACAY